MNASIDKVFAPLITAGGAALIALLTGQAVDLSSVQTALVATASGLVAAGLTYFVPLSRTWFPKKALTSLIPLAAALAHFLQTGEINEPEIVLGVQAIVGFIWTYYAKYIPFVPADAPRGVRTYPDRRG